MPEAVALALRFSAYHGVVHRDDDEPEVDVPALFSARTRHW